VELYLKSSHLEIASAEILLDIGRPVPVAGRPHTAVLVKDGDRDCRSTARLAVIGHGDLKSGVPIDAEWSKWVSDIPDACFSVKDGCTCGAGNRMSSQRGHRVTFDLIRPAAVPDNRVEITFHAGLCVLNVEPEVILRSSASRI